MTNPPDATKGGEFVFDSEYMRLDKYLERAMGEAAGEEGTGDDDELRSWSKHTVQRNYLSFKRPKHLNYTRLRTQSKLEAPAQNNINTTLPSFHNKSHSLKPSSMGHYPTTSMGHARNSLIPPILGKNIKIVSEAEKEKNRSTVQAP